MKLTYDPKHNIAYLSLKKKTNQVETLRVSDSLNIDLTPDGTVYGIELLNANEELESRGGEDLIVVNVATGKKRKVRFTKRRTAS